MSPGPAPSFLELTYENPSFPQLEIECFRLSELRRRMRPGFFARVQRPHFHLLALYTQGQGLQEVDFIRRECRAGTLIHVQPGQVLRYLAFEEAEAELLLFTPGFVWSAQGRNLEELAAHEAFERLTHLTLTDPGFETIRAGFEGLAREYRRTNGGKLSEGIMRHQLMALLLQIGREAPPQRAEAAPHRQRDTFVRFRDQVEKAYMRTRTLEDYARELGCAPKTLNRASQAVAGAPAKQYIDERVALEAKRLLAHTALSVTEIAGRLGFSEPTNFIKFFRREAGMLPGEFRQAFK